MLLLLMDKLRRWWWVCAIIALYMVFATLFAVSVADDEPLLAAIMYVTAVMSSFTLHMGLHKDEVRAVTTLPVRRNDVETALWVHGVLFPVAGVVLGAAIALPLQRAMARFFDESTITLQLSDLPLISLVSLSLIGSACLAFETTAEVSRRVLAAPEGWRHELRAYKSAWPVLPALAVIGAILHRAPLNWSMVGWRQAATLTAGLATTGVSFHYRRLLITGAQIIGSSKLATKAKHATPVRFGSRNWPRIRIYVLGAAFVLAGCGLLYLPEVAMATFPVEANLLYLDAVSFRDDSIRYLVAMGLALTTAFLAVQVNPPHVLRSLPMSPARITRRVAGLHFAVFAAFLVGIAPLTMLTRTPEFLLLVPLAMGGSLAGTAAMIGVHWTAPRWVLLCPFAWLLGVVLTFLELSALALAVIGCILAVLGISGLYLALTRSTTPYRKDLFTRGDTRWQ